MSLFLEDISQGFREVLKQPSATELAWEGPDFKLELQQESLYSNIIIIQTNWPVKFRVYDHYFAKVIGVQTYESYYSQWDDRKQAYRLKFPRQVFMSFLRSLLIECPQVENNYFLIDGQSKQLVSRQTFSNSPCDRVVIQSNLDNDFQIFKLQQGLTFKLLDETLHPFIIDTPIGVSLQIVSSKKYLERQALMVQKQEEMLQQLEDEQKQKQEEYERQKQQEEELRRQEEEYQNQLKQEQERQFQAEVQKCENIRTQIGDYIQQVQQVIKASEQLTSDCFNTKMQQDKIYFGIDFNRRMLEEMQPLENLVYEQLQKSAQAQKTFEEATNTMCAALNEQNFYQSISADFQNGLSPSQKLYKLKQQYEQIAQEYENQQNTLLKVYFERNQLKNQKLQSGILLQQQYLKYPGSYPTQQPVYDFEQLKQKAQEVAQLQQQINGNKNDTDQLQEQQLQYHQQLLNSRQQQEQELQEYQRQQQIQQYKQQMHDSRIQEQQEQLQEQQKLSNSNFTVQTKPTGITDVNSYQQYLQLQDQLSSQNQMEQQNNEQIEQEQGPQREAPKPINIPDQYPNYSKRLVVKEGDLDEGQADPNQTQYPQTEQQSQSEEQIEANLVDDNIDQLIKEDPELARQITNKMAELAEDKYKNWQEEYDEYIEQLKQQRAYLEEKKKFLQNLLSKVEYSDYPRVNQITEDLMDIDSMLTQYENAVKPPNKEEVQEFVNKQFIENPKQFLNPIFLNEETHKLKYAANSLNSKFNNMKVKIDNYQQLNENIENSKPQPDRKYRIAPIIRIKENAYKTNENEYLNELLEYSPEGILKFRNDIEDQNLAGKEVPVVIANGTQAYLINGRRLNKFNFDNLNRLDAAGNNGNNNYYLNDNIQFNHQSRNGVTQLKTIDQLKNSLYFDKNRVLRYRNTNRVDPTNKGKPVEIIRTPNGPVYVFRFNSGNRKVKREVPIKEFLQLNLKKINPDQVIYQLIDPIVDQNGKLLIPGVKEEDGQEQQQDGTLKKAAKKVIKTVIGGKQVDALQGKLFYDDKGTLRYKDSKIPVTVQNINGVQNYILQPYEISIPKQEFDTYNQIIW